MPSRRRHEPCEEILDEKGHDVLQIDADASVFDAVKRMVEAGVGSLLVTEGGETPRSSPGGTISTV